MNDLFLLGAGEHGAVVYRELRGIGRWVTAFVDPFSKLESFHDLPVKREMPKQGDYLVTIGSIRSNPVRAHVFYDARSAGLKAATLIGRAVMTEPAESPKIGAGSMILSGSYVGGGVTIGENVIINHRALIEHDCVIEDHVHICPGVVLGGDVHVERGAHVGIGAIVRQGIRIGVGATVGAGAVVVQNVPDGMTVVGVPARELVRRPKPLTLMEQPFLHAGD